MEGCEFSAITPNEILCDQLVFGIQDNKVRERLLKETNLTKEKTNEICRAVESMVAQMKNTPGTVVNIVKTRRPPAQTPISKQPLQAYYNM